MKWHNSTEFCFVFSSFVDKDEDMDEEVFYLEGPFGFAINIVQSVLSGTGCEKGS